jgi:hypothetical protein
VGDPARQHGLERGAGLDSPADKVDDFKPVPRGENSLGPTSAGHDLSIVFDGHAVSLKSERCNKVIESCRLLEIGKGAGLAIENEC